MTVLKLHNRRVMTGNKISVSNAADKFTSLVKTTRIRRVTMSTRSGSAKDYQAVSGRKGASALRRILKKAAHKKVRTQRIEIED